MVKLVAPAGACAIFCTTFVIICSFLPSSTNAGRLPPSAPPVSHVLVTSTAATPTRAKKVEQNPPTTTVDPLTNTTDAPLMATPPPVTDLVATIIDNATAGIETVIEEEVGSTEPFVHSFVVHSDIKFRYSRTRITSAIVNPHQNQSHEVSFNVTLPEKAFIFQFSMTVDGQVYDAYIDERASAAETYDKEKKKGKSAGLAQTETTRNAQRFTILANVKASSAVIFTLTYEELLERQYSHYEQVIHIESEEVRNSGIIVSIADTKNITMLHAVERDNRDDTDKPMTGVAIEVDGAYGILAWTPNATLNETTGRRMPERFVVQYDVDHHPGAGEILVRDGYFVHFFAPQAPAYPKHVIFVLDISGSMDYRNRIGQLREAMAKILGDLLYNHQRDYFSIITFSDDVYIWNGGGSSAGVYPVTTGNIDKARAFTNSLRATYSTNIRDALRTALDVASNGPRQQRADPMILFLTDGYGNRNAAETRKYITALNTGRAVPVPIYSLAFGKGADYKSLKFLSLLNQGTARLIYEDSDAALQLENFYGEISSPLLNGVTFDYTSDQYNVSQVTKRKFSRLFKGTELVVAGKILPLEGSKADPRHWSYDPSQGGAGNQTAPTPPILNAQVSGQPGTGAGTTVFSQPDVNTDDAPISQFTFPNTTSLFSNEEDDFFMERLWAYLTVKQLLEDAEAEADFQAASGGSSVITYAAGEDPRIRARDLAIEYKFVTPLTSLVVVMPDSGEVDLDQDAGTFSELKPQVQSSGPVVKSFDPLEGISWLKPDDIFIQIRDPAGKYVVARDNSAANVVPIPGNRCGAQSSCTHLRDCVRPQIKQNFGVYERSYFCGLQSLTSSPVLYAGVCCPGATTTG